MAAKTNLPSPKSRSKPDPSNTNRVSPVSLAIAEDNNDAVCTVDSFGSLRGIPQAELTGGAHALPLLPVSATQEGLGVIRLHYAEHVANGDILTWPEQDPAIRNKPGGYVMPEAFTVGGTIATAPQIIDITINADDAEGAFTFDQDMAAAGPSVSGQIFATDNDNVQWQTLSVVSIVGAVVTCSLGYSVITSTSGTSTSMAIGTALVGLVGGLPANEWNDFAVTFTPPVAAPFPIHIFNNTLGTPGQYTYWNCAITRVGTSNDTTYDNGTRRLDNTLPLFLLDNSQVYAVCDNDVGASSNPNTLSMLAGTVVGTVSGVNNAAFLNQPCPDEP